MEKRGGTTRVQLSDIVSPVELLRIERLARELRLTDQILSIDVDRVDVVESGPAPAWTTLDGDSISFNYTKMPKLVVGFDRTDIAVWLGTNAHELGHVLFSPRRSSTLMYRVIESDRAFLPGMARLHNIIEDQREERLLLARFAPWTGYLTAALGHHLTADDNSAWLLMAGRTWLPQAVRDVAKARMIAHRGQRETDQVTRIIGEYQRLTDPGDSEADIAWELHEELYAIFQDELPPGGGCGTPVMTGGTPDTGEPGESVPSTADEADAGGGAGNADCPSDADDDADDDADGTGAGDDDGDDDNGRQTNPFNRDDTSDSGGSGGKGAGTGPRAKPDPNQPVDQDKLRDALKNAGREQIDQDAEASSDLDSVADAIDYGRAGDKAEGAEGIGDMREATTAARLLHREVSDALLDLKDESEPGWNRRVDSGRLKVSRLVNPNVDADELFDRYEPGMMDSTELEVVLALDVSGSMSMQTMPLAEATWAIRHSVDDLEGTITVFTYDHGPHRILAEAGVRPDARMFVPRASGGTDPSSSIREAYRLLAGSEARNRLFIILTDGEWAAAHRTTDDVIRAMAEAGVTTVYAHLGGAMRTQHGCQYAASINDPMELARLFRRVAAERFLSWR